MSGWGRQHFHHSYLGRFWFWHGYAHFRHNKLCPSKKGLDQSLEGPLDRFDSEIANLVRRSSRRNITSLLRRYYQRQRYLFG